MTNTRRIVTGLNEEGKSCVIINDELRFSDNQAAQILWRSSSLPADNSGTLDQKSPYNVNFLHDGGANFIITQLPPKMNEPAFMHATDTLDFLVIISGEVVLYLETEEVIARAGDLIVDRGVIHGWRNVSEMPAVYAAVTMPAIPVGKGRTI